MKVLHIVPAAFNYFEDIKTVVFNLIDIQSQLGVEVEAFTVQYQAPARVKSALESKPGEEGSDENKPGPNWKYQGTITIEEIEKNITSFQAVHVHVPIFGLVGKILTWKKKYPSLKVIVTVHRPSRTPDWFSLILLIYNRIMLPRIFAVANYITALTTNTLYSFYRSMVAPYSGRVVEVDATPNFLGEKLMEQFPETAKMVPAELLAFKYVILYNSN